MKKLIFFAIASAILLFSIIVVNIAPFTNGQDGGTSWFRQPCNSYSHWYDDIDKKSLSDLGYDQKEKDELLDDIKKQGNRCNRRKAMVGLEYVASNLNIVFGFICALLGFLYFINVGDVGKYIGLIGLGAGFIGFVLTFVYVIESGLVFNDIDDSNNIRIDSDGAYLKWNGSKGRYTCMFYDKDDKDSVYRRFSDYGNNFLNYNKDLYYPNGDNEYIYKSVVNGGCIYRSLSLDGSTVWESCRKLDEANSNSEIIGLGSLGGQNFYGPGSKLCDKLYYVDSYSYNPLIHPTATDNENKIIYDRWLTSLILSCFIFLFDIGLAIFGFLLFNDSKGSSGSVAIK